jgi:hypothetical protein
MKALNRFEEEFSGFSGGVSGFGDSDFARVLRDESAVPGTGLSVSMVQSVARRQLVGSIVVLAIIGVFAALTALRPAHTASVAAAAHGFPTVQQPVLETPASDRLAAVKRHTELP